MLRWSVDMIWNEGALRHSNKQQACQCLWLVKVWECWVVYRDVWASSMILWVRVRIYVCFCLRGGNIVPEFVKKKPVFLLANHILSVNESHGVNKVLPKHTAAMILLTVCTAETWRSFPPDHCNLTRLHLCSKILPSDKNDYKQKNSLIMVDVRV